FLAAAKNLQYQVVLGPGMGGKISSQTDYIVFSGATIFANNERTENPPEDIHQTTYFRGDVQWAAFQNKYFGSALIPLDGTKTGLVFKEKDQAYVGLGFESVQSSANAKYMFYAGTKELEILEDKKHHLVRMIDYGWFGNKFAFLVKPLLKVLAFFYGVTNNYGWSIIFMTCCIKLLFFPLTHKSFKSMKGMQKVQPYVKVIQERNKDDRKKMNEEMMELYKKHKVNPVGGCLPMLLQIPVFIALYHALFFSIELRGAPFMAWITDLSVADPYYVFPVLMGATMFIQQKLTPSMGDPMQQKIMMFLPIVFTFLFLSFPAGLVIYWTVNNILTISQQYYIYHVMKD
ncbi:MAG: membrane protein insertase YidC, partial [Nitrospinaceae bacterium]